MPVFENTFTVAVAPETAFDYLADRTKELEWNPACLFVEPLTDGPVRAGSRWRAKWKGGPVVEGSVIDYDRPRQVTSGHDGALSVRSTWTFTESGDGTHVVSHFEATPHGFMKVMFPLFARSFRKQSSEAIQRIAQILENQGGQFNPGQSSPRTPSSRA